MFVQTWDFTSLPAPFKYLLFHYSYVITGIIKINTEYMVNQSKPNKNIDHIEPTSKLISSRTTHVSVVVIYIYLFIYIILYNIHIMIEFRRGKDNFVLPITTSFWIVFSTLGLQWGDGTVIAFAVDMQINHEYIMCSCRHEVSHDAHSSTLI